MGIMDIFRKSTTGNQTQTQTFNLTESKTIKTQKNNGNNDDNIPEKVFRKTSSNNPSLTSENLPKYVDLNQTAQSLPSFDLEKFDSLSSEVSPTKTIEMVHSGNRLLGKASNISDDILQLITPKIATDYRVLPVEIVDNELFVLFAGGFSSNTAHRIIENSLASKKLKYKISFHQTTWDLLKPFIDSSYTNSFDTYQISSEYKDWFNKNHDDGFKGLVLDANQRSIEKNPYRAFFIDCCSIAHRRRATDLDFDLDRIPQPNGDTLLKLRVRINVDGQKIAIVHDKTQESDYRRFCVALKSLADLDTSDIHTATTGLINAYLTYGSRSVRVEIRCNVMPQENGVMSFSFRIQVPDEFNYTPDNLGMFPEQQKLMDLHYVNGVKGLALFVGRTGAGKNTTQITFLKKRVDVRPHDKIITIEDPIEVRIAGISQFSVKPERGYEYFIPAAMRHVPDVLTIGEVRDRKTVELIVGAAQTGHFTSGTVHADSSSEAITRMRSLGVQQEGFAGSLAGCLRIIITQKLLRKSCSVCLKEQDPEVDNIPFLQQLIEKVNSKLKLNKTQLLKSSGIMPDGSQCKNCQGKGTKGRVGVFEVMVPNSEIRDLIVSGAPDYKIHQRAVANGMTTLWANGLRRVLYADVSLTNLIAELGYPDPEQEGIKASTLLSDTDSDIEIPTLN